MLPPVLQSQDAALDRLLEITERIAMNGDLGAVDTLLAFAGAQHQHPRIASLAEAVSRLVVQLEAREFRLECTIEDLLQVKSELEAANYDPLTGLPNRVIFRDRLRQGLAQTERSGRMLAVFFLDLDRFKWVNDNLGHEAGDELLKQVAGRLRSCVRGADTLARLGGDEFTCVQPDIEHPEHAVEVAQRFVSSLTAPFQLAAGPAHIGTSVGIALFPVHDTDVDALIKFADQAMYQAKANGRNGYVLHGV